MKMGKGSQIPAKLPLPFATRPAGTGMEQRKAVQAKVVAASQPPSAKPSRPAPVAPAVYRPQPVPKVLQRKAAPTPTGNNNRAPAAPAPPAHHPQPSLIYRPQPLPRVLPSKMSGEQSGIVTGITPPARVAASAPQRQNAIVQRFRANVVQAVKYYPNLHPGAATPVDRSNIFTLDSFADQYRLRRMNSHGVNVPNMKYNFVRTREGEMRLHSRYRHPSLAEGQQVLYAGEAFFNNGKLQWWSNGSGHYQPDDDNADQAALPMDYFYSYQQIIKGEHLRKKNETGG